MEKIYLLIGFSFYKHIFIKDLKYIYFLFIDLIFFSISIRNLKCFTLFITKLL